MQIKKITLTNIRCFKHFEVDLSNDTGSKKWLVILGENGVGKTTLLRSIALGLCEESGAAGLCAEVPGDWIHNDEREGKIRIEIQPFDGYTGNAYVETTLQRSNYGEVKLSQVTEPKNPSSFKWERLFVCAYGSARSVYGSMDVSEYAVTDSVYSLFNYDTDLQNPELSLRRLEAEKIDLSIILKKLEEVLMIKEGSIKLTRSGIMVDGPWGKPMPIGTLGDGYKSTITWLLDLFGWKLLSESHLSDLDLEGIIILDEMEKHLHPKWQKQLVGNLSKQFPKLQFITSTHSPLCVIGTTELDDSECCITVSRQEIDSVETQITVPPRGKRADQVLTSYLFDLYTTSDNQIKKNIERYNYLYNLDTRNEEQLGEQKNLFNELNGTIGSAETDLEKKVGAVLNKSLELLFDNEMKKNIEKESPERFELLRQLKDLL